MPTRLLIADDNTIFQKVFERTFPPKEFSITFANDGKEALATAQEDKPDLILADIKMPLKNGFEICEEVKKDPHLKGTPVLLLIGILDDFDEDESCRVGADGFIVKPFEANAAISKVREVLTLEEGAPSLETPLETIPSLQEAVEEGIEEPVEETLPGGEAVEEAIPLEEAVEEALPREEAVKEEEEVLALEEVVEEPAAASSPPHEEQEIVQQITSRQPEMELKQEFPEEKEEPLTLDLPIGEINLESITRVAEEDGLLDELGVEAAQEDLKAERLEIIPDESEAELEKIEGLAPKREAKEIKTVEEFQEKFMEVFEPVFEADKEGSKRTGTLEKDLEGVSKETMEGLVERLSTALCHELRNAVQELIGEKFPILLRQEMERLRKG